VPAPLWRHPKLYLRLPTGAPMHHTPSNKKGALLPL